MKVVKKVCVYDQSASKNSLWKNLLDVWNSVWNSWSVTVQFINNLNWNMLNSKRSFYKTESALSFHNIDFNHVKCLNANWNVFLCCLENFHAIFCNPKNWFFFSLPGRIKFQENEFIHLYLKHSCSKCPQIVELSHRSSKHHKQMPGPISFDT